MKTIPHSIEVSDLIAALTDIDHELQTMSQKSTPNPDFPKALDLKRRAVNISEQLLLKAKEDHLYCKLDALLTDRERDDPDNEYYVIERLSAHIDSEALKFSRHDFDH
tara:strand:+ start:91 stop:414 length:324 start_codon:yes stop_codon:yes gene_type:complete